jgi:uncharacterized iron-regulated membrane protein
MEDIFGGIIFSILGGLYLWIRYRNKKKVLEIKKNEYDNKYSNVGHVMILKIILVTFILLIIGLLLSPLYRMIIK